LDAASPKPCRKTLRMFSSIRAGRRLCSKDRRMGGEMAAGLSGSQEQGRKVIEENSDCYGTSKLRRQETAVESSRTELLSKADRD
jgi:hypothetical protein